ncbi:sulfotransferase [Candidatus Bipolaricaulota bacterium]|nr:sulfotransferase [Candidatus Bipolaricaulota bacterium]
MSTHQSDMRPVLICGYPKSGTTLLLALLDRHPELLVFPEEGRFFKRELRTVGAPSVEAALEHTGATALRYGEIRWGSGFRDYADIDFPTYEAFARRRWEASDRTWKALCETVILAYGDVTNQLPRAHWVEKTPRNELHLAEAIRWWPNLKAICVLRDPRDNYCSYRKKRTNDARSLPIEEFVAGWCRGLSAWDRFVANGGDGLLVRYCDLVESPEESMRRVCAFLSIGWDDALLQPTRNGIPWSGNSMTGERFDGISATMVGRYRSELAPSVVREIEHWLARIVAGYGWTFDHSASLPRLAMGSILARPSVVRARLRALREVRRTLTVQRTTTGRPR